MGSSVFIHGFVSGMNNALMDAGLVSYPNEKVANEVSKSVADRFRGPEFLPSEGIGKTSALKIANELINTFNYLKNQGYNLVNPEFTKKAASQTFEDRANAEAVLCMQKAASDASLADKTDNTPEQAAQNDSVGALDMQNRGPAEYVMEMGQTALDTSGAEVGKEKEAQDLENAYAAALQAAPAAPTIPPAVQNAGGGMLNALKDLSTGQKALAAAGAAAIPAAGYMAYRYFKTPQGDVVPVPSHSAEDTPMEVLSSIYDPMEIAAEFISKVGSFSPTVKVAAATLAVNQDLASMNFIIENAKIAEQLCEAAINEGEKTASLADTNFILALNTIEKVAGGAADKAREALGKVKEYAGKLPGVKDLSKAKEMFKDVQHHKANFNPEALGSAHNMKNVLTTAAKGVGKAGLTAAGVAAAGMGASALKDKVTGKDKEASVSDKLKGVKDSLSSALKDTKARMQSPSEIAKNVTGVSDLSSALKILKEKGTGANVSALDQLKGVSKNVAMGAAKAGLTAGAVAGAAMGAKALKDKVTGKDKEKTSSLLAQLKAAADGSLNNTDENTLNNAAQDDSVAELDKENRPEGAYTGAMGHTSLDTSGAEVGKEKEVTAEEKEYIEIVTKLAHVYGDKLPAHLSDDQKLAHIQQLAALPPNSRLQYLAQIK